MVSLPSAPYDGESSYIEADEAVSCDRTIEVFGIEVPNEIICDAGHGSICFISTFKSICPWFLRCSSLTMVSFEPNSCVEHLCESALSYTQLRCICIPSSVVVIDNNCFDSCSGLEVVCFEETSSVAKIGISAFKSTRLRLIEIPSSVCELGVNCFASCFGFVSIQFENNSRLEALNECFGGTNLVSIVIPRNVRVIGSGCFREVETLERVEFESDSSLVQVSDAAFKLCTSLERICLPSSVQSIGDKCFMYCRSLSSFTFSSKPRKLEHVGHYLFEGTPLSDSAVSDAVSAAPD